jgi:phenylalanyl-tRNA synthetase beta chain
MLSLLLHGQLAPPSWGTSSPPQTSFHAAKGRLEALLAALRVPWSVEAASQPFLHPGRSAALIVGGEPAGWLGEIHPLVAREWDLRTTAGFEVDLDLIVSHAVAVPRYEPLSEFPPARRDLALTVPVALPAADLLASVRSSGPAILREVSIFDVYEGAQAGEGRKSVALRLAFQAPDRTLTDEEVDAAIEKIVAAGDRDLGASVRG